MEDIVCDLGSGFDSCLICSFSLKKSCNIPNLTSEKPDIVLQVCSSYLLPNLLSVDVLQNIDFSLGFPLFFCPDCGQVINKLVKMHGDLTRIQQEIQKIVDSLSNSVLYRRGKDKNINEVQEHSLDRERSQFPNPDPNEEFKLETNFCQNETNNNNGVEVNLLQSDENNDIFNSSVLSSNTNSQTLEKFQLKELSICLERIDNMKGCLNSTNEKTSTISSTQFTTENFDDENFLDVSDPIEDLLTSESRSPTENIENESINQEESLNDLGMDKLENKFLTGPNGKQLCGNKEIRFVLEKISVKDVTADLQEIKVENSLQFENIGSLECNPDHSDWENTEELEAKIKVEEFVPEDCTPPLNDMYDSYDYQSVIEKREVDDIKNDYGIENMDIEHSNSEDDESQDGHTVESEENDSDNIEGRTTKFRQRKAAIKANSKILHFSEVFNSEKSTVLSEEDSSYEESSDDLTDDEMDVEENHASKNSINVGKGLVSRKRNKTMLSPTIPQKRRVQSVLKKGKLCSKKISSERDREILNEEVLYECQVCHEKFGTHFDYFKHTLDSECPINNETQNNPEIFDCEDCGKSFKAKYILLNHGARKHNDGHCTICNQKPSDIDHFVIHTAEVACVCDICGMPLSRFRHLQPHRLSHIQKVSDTSTIKDDGLSNPFYETPIECKTCQEKFLCPFEYLYHLRNSPCPPIPNDGTVTPESFQCEMCDKQFKAKYLLLQHRVNKHLSRKCDICNKHFSGKKTVKYDHFLEHTGEILCNCDICGKPILRFRHFKSHRLSHTWKESTLRCEHDGCSKEFKTILGLTEHMEWHHNLESGKRFCCEICGKEYLVLNVLKAHMRTHLPESHLCNICGKTFSTKYLLNNHSKKHTSHFHPCALCDKKFKEKYNLKKHYRIEHLKEPRTIYACELCDKSFTTSKGKIDHVSAVHTKEKPFQCESCGESFPVKSHLKIHVKVNHSTGQLECPVCKKTFSNPISLYNHSRIHGEKKFKCDICQKGFTTSFNLTTHMRSHSGIRPYQCDECGKAFTRKDNLSTHIKKHEKDKQGLHNCETCGETFSNKNKLSAHIKKNHNLKSKLSKRKKAVSETGCHSSLNTEFNNE